MKTTVFLTGATGTMGWAGLQELLAHHENYNIRILARKSQKNIDKLASIQDKIDIVWGDLTSYEDVLQGVTGSDIVLHVGGMVSPQADYRPNATRRTNLTAAENIIKAVLAQPEEKQPKVVYVGSVAQMGDRREPLHWGRTGDPICISAYDHYGLTKARAEYAITNSSIKNWVSLRQSGILYPAILKNYDPIMFHVPIRGVLEWATVEDSGRLLERICRPEVPADFWCRYYNIGSGAEYRISNYRFEQLLLQAIGCPMPEKIFNAQWFTTRNFHGMWYLDSDVLESYMHFRANLPVEQYFDQMSRSASIPAGIKIAKATQAAKLVPHIVKLAMRAMAYSHEHGTQWWIRNNKEERIHAYYGSLEAYRNIPDWAHTDLTEPTQTPVLLNHGYDESKKIEDLTEAELEAAARFRGGHYLGRNEQGLHTWQCAQGHTFTASPRVILLGGHWCPDCMPNPYSPETLSKEAKKKGTEPETSRPWQWDKRAKENPFLAQLWAPLHDANEDNTYDYHIFDNWEK